jgi:predicted acyl esterase
MDEPIVRAWMQESVRPAPDYELRPGRWVTETTWPRQEEEVRFELDASGLCDRSQDSAQLSHRSVQTVGLEAGAWCPYGGRADLPTDQRRDDALSLAFDSTRLAERLELLGQPELKLRVASDRASAFVVARLCDVAPDGSSTVITRGVLNLCHRSGHAVPEALLPGVAVDVSVPLRSVAYAVPPGHRIRLALSTSYWPWLWPSPRPATITITTGGTSFLMLPRRTPRGDDGGLTFEAAETAQPLPVTILREREPMQQVTTDIAERTVRVLMRRDFVGAQRLPSGLEYRDYDPVTLTIRDDDPLSARVECERLVEVGRAGWRTRVHVRSQMTASASDYLITSVIEAYEGDTRIHARTFQSTIPRNNS